MINKKEKYKLRWKNIHSKMKQLMFAEYDFKINAKHRSKGRGKGTYPTHTDKKVFTLLFRLQYDLHKLYDYSYNQRNNEINDRISIIIHAMKYVMKFSNFDNVEYPITFVIDLKEKELI